jgi:endoglucanase
MKKIVLFAVLLFIGMATYAGPVSKHGQLKVEGTHLVDKNGQAITLRGVSFGWSCWYGKFYNEPAIDWLTSDWECSVVRAAIGAEPQGGYISEPEKQGALLTAVIDAAIKNDIYVIIDWHSHGIRTKEAVEFFSQFSAKYAKYPNIIYEIFNEPVQQSWDEVKAYSVEVIQAIRANDKNNVILVGNTHWDQDVHIAADQPITGYTNLMYTLHFYAATHKNELLKKADYALSKGLPLFVSECAAMEASGDGPFDLTSWNTWLNWMETNKISWACWSLSSKNETCSMIKDDSISPNGKWKEDELKEWGRITREAIKKHQK